MSLPRQLTTLAALATPLAVTGALLVPTTAHAAVATSPTTGVSGAAWPGHPDRVLVPHRVRAGETATALAVRYHAWTRELLALNGLRASGQIHVGQRLRIPVVVSAVRKAQKPAAAPKPAATAPSALSGPRWTHADMTRTQVRRLIVSTARAHGVPPTLALAVAWQESGWQQRRKSPAGAIGVMQVLPSTGEWMRWYAGRPLRIRDTHDNVLTGVLTLRYLLRNTRIDNRAIGAYYQGLGAVRSRGLFDDTVQYIAAVRAHQARIIRTGSPI
jgi:soluble lytic murein transglycosylase-like protein